MGFREIIRQHYSYGLTSHIKPRCHVTQLSKSSLHGKSRSWKNGKPEHESSELSAVKTKKKKLGFQDARRTDPTITNQLPGQGPHVRALKTSYKCAETKKDTTTPNNIWEFPAILEVEWTMMMTCTLRKH
ncbi:hypothetical protein GCK72_014650 [Caenorhabditis remanei]|uniref:Uncharacterized protein n=1 Tax=Caenorhabditis remanei TaxID=31234 RepID=A0A6A5GV12_CAERE|nr:hypothetical protein GCK72_014650 [Caenorhabditis remanei]KAF1758192.1 hypothetical protein GCK72_014650 [Caenorhabditis remanei]